MGFLSAQHSYYYYYLLIVTSLFIFSTCVRVRLHHTLYGMAVHCRAPYTHSDTATTFAEISPELWGGTATQCATMYDKGVSSQFTCLNCWNKLLTRSGILENCGSFKSQDYLNCITSQFDQMSLWSNRTVFYHERGSMKSSHQSAHFSFHLVTV